MVKRRRRAQRRGKGGGGGGGSTPGGRQSTRAGPRPAAAPSRLSRSSVRSAAPTTASTTSTGPTSTRTAAAAAGKSSRVRTPPSNRQQRRKPATSSSAASSPADKPHQEEHACTAEEKPNDEATPVENSDDRQVPAQNGDDSDKSRDAMTSSDPERGDSGDGGVDDGQQTSAMPASDDTAEQTTTTHDEQTVTQTTTTDSAADTTNDRKENSDEPETKTASSESLPFSCGVHITITCGDNEALMYLGARVTSGKERARDRRVLFNGSWLTPNEFQTVSGRGAAKDWKRTVKHAGQCIKALLAARLLSVETEPVGCLCKHCTGCSAGTESPQDTAVRSPSGDDARPTQSRDASDVTSGSPTVTSSSREVELTGSSARAKRKGGCVVRQSDRVATTGGVVGCHGDGMTSSDVVKDEKSEESDSSSSASSSEVMSLRELELAAATGRTSYGKLDDVKASKFDHLNRVIAELKRTKSKQSSTEASAAGAYAQPHGGDAGVKVSCSAARLHNAPASHLNIARASHLLPPHQHSSSISATTAPVATMPLLPFPGAFPGGFCGLSPAQLAPLQMYPPYIFMGFPLHPQLLQSYSVPTADSQATHQPGNPAKRTSTQPMDSPPRDKLYRMSDSATNTLHSVGHVAYLPLVTSPPTQVASRDRKHLPTMTSSGGRGSSDSRQGAGDFDQDGALDLTKK